MKTRVSMIVGCVLGLPLLGFLVIQLIPVWLWQTNPVVVAEPNWDSAATRAMAQRACFDCHSNETVWPWYSKVAPVSWLVTKDVVEGRQRLNFSEWGVARGGREGRDPLKDLNKVLTRGQMPPNKYLLIHPEAKLTEAERQQLLDGLTATLSQP